MSHWFTSVQDLNITGRGVGEGGVNCIIHMHYFFFWSTVIYDEYLFTWCRSGYVYKVACHNVMEHSCMTSFFIAVSCLNLSQDVSSLCLCMEQTIVHSTPVCGTYSITCNHVSREYLYIATSVLVAPMLAIINGLNGSLLDKYLCMCTLMSE